MPKCPKCAKEVYFAERVTSLGKDWHRPCLKCEKCGKTLSPGSHAEISWIRAHAGMFSQPCTNSTSTISFCLSVNLSVSPCSMMASRTVIIPATLLNSGLKDLDVVELKATHLPSRPSQFNIPHQMGYKKATPHSTAYSILYFIKGNYQKSKCFELPFMLFLVLVLCSLEHFVLTQQSSSLVLLEVGKVI
uniref:LIM zinc-binding domain-containing protein n=1 Tax=Esox lucius TaxID=8010 RepID=A0A3P9AKX8_ESOLU